MDEFYKNKNYFNQYRYYENTYDPLNYYNSCKRMDSNYIKDFTQDTFVINIEEITRQNNTFRTTLWTGEHLQVTLMSINVGESIGLEMHADTDQFIRIEDGVGLVQMGNDQNHLTFERKVYDNYAFIIPAGKWHNLINIGNTPIKLYSIYAPPHHLKGTVHYTKQDSEAEH